MTEVTRIAQPIDAEAIAHVLAEAFREFKPLYTPAGYTATTPDAPGMLLRMESATTLITEVDRQIAATASYVDQRDALYILGMAVLPGFRGRGLAGRLLDRVESEARRLGKSRLLLSTTPFLDGAIALYRRHGFVRVPDSDHDLHGTPLFDMSKHL